MENDLLKTNDGISLSKYCGELRERLLMMGCRLIINGFETDAKEVHVYDWPENLLN